MKILCTGITGFIGSVLAQKLSEKHEVIGIARYNTTRSLHVPYSVVYGDVTDHFFLKKALREIQPDVIIHLAAVSPVQYSYEHPIEVTETNYLGTVNLVELSKHLESLQHLIFASTSETYGIQDKIPISEDAPLRPNTPYAIAKTAAEHYIRNYMGEGYDFPFTIAKPFNTFGRKDTNKFVVESLITKMLNHKVIEAGDPTPIRDFLYVDDHVNAYATLVEKGPQRDIFNFCTGRGVSIKELQIIIASLMNWKGEVHWNTTYQRPTDAGPLVGIVGNDSKAKIKLGWEPQFTLEEGLQRTIAYWRTKY